MLNPFEAVVPFWVFISALAVLLIGLVLGLLTERFTPQFKPTRLQWLGLYVLYLVLFLGAYLLSTRGMQLFGTFPIIFALVSNFGMQLWSSRSQQNSSSKGAQE